VPTVALAIDQYRAARELPLLSHLDARYFAADDPDFSAQQVADAVRAGSTRLLFTSPEACVSGRLRYVIDELASQGRLDHVVIDEAHMVGTWGIYFRVDFQLLSTHWRQWRERSGHNLRTVLLSATFTPECREGLKILFPSDDWSEFTSQRLRPEISYYVKNFDSSADRDGAVLECIWQLPRPAILYTTRVEDAYSFHRRLQHDDFRRVECFTGETPRVQRRGLLERWRGDDIDVMVATSAFGLGVDKPDVRTILHACIPENLDRFYQEVGRAGRDGYSAVSVLLATKRDVHVANGMGPSLLRPETIQQRWESLWRTHECVDSDKHQYRVNLPSWVPSEVERKFESVVIAEQWKLHGRMDLIEQSAEGAIRVTDYKTGNYPDPAPQFTGGGEVLQPVLYALASEQLFPGRRIAGGRLFYATLRGGYRTIDVPLNDQTRAEADRVLSTIESAVQAGRFPAAPREDACESCDYLAVCGPYEEERVRRKPQGDLESLIQLRSVK
jgi:CRISPR/Cas system-associated exonuclease Cas4 (RecB family)